ncbi:MAG: hypothetical protein ACRDP9_19735 [Kribbellaceae bacterium]
MKLRSLALLGAGYVLGAKAGRERYAQIVEAAEKASQRLDEFRRQRAKPSQRVGDIDSFLDESRGE